MRDHVQGVRVVTGDGRALRFGGEVLKNVAGYDVSRLMVGSLGILGVLLDISLRVLPRPAAELTLVFEVVILGLGLFISTISRTQQQASFTTTFFVLPPFLFLSGFSFPIENMPAWIQPLTYFIPLRYYLDVIRGIFLTGVGIEELWRSLAAMLGLGAVIFGASFLRFRKSLE